MPPRRRGAGIAEGIAVAVVVLVATLIIYAWAQRRPSPPPERGVPAPQAETAPAAATEPAMPPRPTHNYVLEENGYYGYQPVLSDTDRQNGIAQKPLAMVRYLGEKNGSYRVEVGREGSYSMVISCKLPCQYIKAQHFNYGELVKTDTLSAEGTMGGDILADAIAGELKPWRR